MFRFMGIVVFASFLVLLLIALDGELFQAVRAHDVLFDFRDVIGVLITFSLFVLDVLFALLGIKRAEGASNLVDLNQRGNHDGQVFLILGERKRRLSHVDGFLRWSALKARDDAETRSDELVVAAVGVLLFERAGEKILRLVLASLFQH